MNDSSNYVPFAAAWERGTQFGEAWRKWISEINWDAMTDAQRTSARHSFQAGWKASDARIYDVDSGELTRHRSTIAAKDTRIAELTEVIRQSNETIKGWEDENDELRATIAEKDARIEELRKWQFALGEFNRLSLVIESAVRTVDPNNYDLVLRAITLTRALMPKWPGTETGRPAPIE